ncbi:uncharacterized protein LOC130991861 isoform X2 [Salvia miltiorrhiza]|uniref:uncharacterized protein LOC130991861 isoform X2 n=1 Tax=Salvia miltiorrhiza TaxID=226208 RepID=UPI0025ACAC26|nr:uncharacterized protein LOC130991861 isoform X2 [Salvia miltiorrhiza]
MAESAQQSHEESMLLRTEPSFCIYTDDEFGEQVGNVEVMREKIERAATIGENGETEFSFGENGMRVIEEAEDEDEDEKEEEEKTPRRFRDLKIETGGDRISPPIFQAEGGGGDAAALNKWRSHAAYLESTGDLYGAEEYYFRATEADPKDGELLSQYAKLVWQLHGDQAKASRYFQKAVEAAPVNSDVLAAYASFLWDVDESEEGEHLSDDAQVDENPAMVDSFGGDYTEEMRPSSPTLHLAMGLGLDASGFRSFDNDESTNVEEYYKRMVEENPRNVSFLRDYALFLHQKKGDLEGAEEYYSRGILEEPRDGQMLYLYAGIVWQLHHDKDRAAAYFERAVEASPMDSNVLAAYAKFLWETEGEEAAIDEAQRSSN